MRESRSCGSERGAPSNGRPYREKPTDLTYLAMPSTSPAPARLNFAAKLAKWTEGFDSAH